MVIGEINPNLLKGGWLECNHFLTQSDFETQIHDLNKLNVYLIVIEVKSKAVEFGWPERSDNWTQLIAAVIVPLLSSYARSNSQAETRESNKLNWTVED